MPSAPPPNRETVGQIITRVRDLRGLTRHTLACKAGVQANYLARIEDGLTQPGLAKAIQIFRALAAHDEWAALLEREAE